MTIVYRNPGPWGAGLGSRLPSLTVDENFYDVDQRINGITTDIHGGAVVSISEITVTDAGQMYITLTNGAIQGPFTLPTGTWRFRGAWQTFTNYAVGDVVQVGVSLYLVIFAHLSGSFFDPGANDGSGHDYYQLLLTMQSAPVETVTTATYTLNILDGGFYIRFTHSSGCVLTVPDNSTVAFAVGTEIHCRDASTLSGDVGGLSVITAGSAVIHPVHGYLNETAASGGTFTLKKVATNEWDIMGLLAAS